MKGLSSENKKWRNNNAQSQLRKITDKKGKLESYQRKTIIYGDGFHAPEQRIGKTQTMNQKLVFVELKVTNTTKETTGIVATDPTEVARGYPEGRRGEGIYVYHRSGSFALYGY